MIKKEFFHDSYGRPTYLLGLGEDTYMRYYLKKNDSDYYEFWDCDFKLENLDYKNIRNAVITKKEFQELKEMIFIYTTCKNAGILHKEYKEFIDDDKVCYYIDLEIEMQDKIDALLRTYC